MDRRMTDGRQQALSENLDRRHSDGPALLPGPGPGVLRTGQAPGGLSATASHDSVTLTWDDPNDDSVPANTTYTKAINEQENHGCRATPGPLNSPVQ